MSGCTRRFDRMPLFRLVPVETPLVLVDHLTLNEGSLIQILARDPRLIEGIKAASNIQPFVPRSRQGPCEGAVRDVIRNYDCVQSARSAVPVVGCSSGRISGDDRLGGCRTT